MVRQYQHLFAYEGVRLEFTPEALTAIARKAIERATGARGLPKNLIVPVQASWVLARAVRAGQSTECDRVE